MMQLRRRLGRTGLEVAPLCLGGNVFGWTADERASFAVLDAYVEAGGNYIDTSGSYSRWAPGNTGGESETIIGKWLKSRGSRSRMVIATKAFSATGPAPHERGLSRFNVMRSIEDSLRRLQTDYVDVFLSHYDDRETPQEETLRVYDELIQEGKVRYLGAGAGAGYIHQLNPEGPARQHTAVRLMRALWISDKNNWPRYDAIEPEYNLFTRVIYEQDLEEVCQDRELGVITRSSLASGFLSGKYRKGAAVPETQRAAEVQKLYFNDRGFAILDELDRVAAEYGVTVPQIALAWIMARPSITAPIASATSVDQLREIVGAAEIRLDPGAIATLTRVSDSPPQLATTRAASGIL
jgi:aryl-alcohol dehydrogenase-like predicted oxidoreductase